LTIPEITIRGTWISGMGQEFSRDVEASLRSMESGLRGAAVALALFEEAHARMAEAPALHEWELAQRERRQASEMLSKQHPRLDAYSAEGRLEVEVIVKKHRWAKGQWPRDYSHEVTFIYARSFVYSLDQIGKTIKGLARFHELSEGKRDRLAEIQARLDTSVPGITSVRDSAHHVEQRVLRRGYVNRRQVDIEPDNGFMSVSNLFGTRLHYTAADGSQQEVDVSSGTLASAQRVVQEAHDVFEWMGPPRHLPS
jgi:hypothetical protein